MTRKLTARGRRRRRELMETGARLFAEQGFHPTSVADIVTDLGVGKGVFYWYFESKQQLLEEILREAHLDLRRRQQAAIAGEPDPSRRIELGIRATLQWFHEHRNRFTLLQLAATDDRFRALLRRHDDVAIADAMAHIKEGIAQGVFVDQDPELMARGILGVMQQLTVSYVFERDEPVEELADAAVSFCLRGLTG